MAQSNELCVGVQELDMSACAPEGPIITVEGQPGCTLCFSRALKLTRKLKQQADGLKIQAETDPLTNLLNRRGLERVLTEFTENRTPLGGISVDVINFGKVNGSRGHAYGDAILRHCAVFLDSQTRSNDEVGFTARQGGDEFFIIQKLNPASELSCPDQLAMAARRLVAGFTQLDTVQDYNKTQAPNQELGLRTGTAIYEAGMDLDTFMQAADSKGPTESLAIPAPASH